MRNKRRFFWVLFAFLMVSCAASHGSDPKPFDRKTHEGQGVAPLLAQLLSPNEATRFRSLDAIKKRAGGLAADEIDRALVFIGEKNVSTLIFYLMETRNDVVYRLSAPAKQVLENTRGSFPNLAYYYARVRPSDGLTVLFGLYETHDASKMAICKAIGETGDPKGAAFLLRKTEQERKAGSRIPMLAGLAMFQLTIDKSRITSLLTAALDREEIILLSKLRTDYSDKELIALYRGNNRSRTYALEYIFRMPEANFEALRFIINEMIVRKQFDRVRELMMSDRIRRSTDERVQTFRDVVMKRVSAEKPLKTSLDLFGLMASVLV